MATVTISDKIKALPPKDLKNWIAGIEKFDISEDLKTELEKLKKGIEDAKGTKRKGKND